MGVAYQYPTVMKGPLIHAPARHQWEREWLDRTEQPRDKHQENIRIDLHHVHLPQMAENGVIDYDARSEMVRSRINTSVLATVDQEANECPRLEDLFTDIEVRS